MSQSCSRSWELISLGIGLRMEGLRVELLGIVIDVVEPLASLACGDPPRQPKNTDRNPLTQQHHAPLHSASFFSCSRSIKLQLQSRSYNSSTLWCEDKELRNFEVRRGSKWLTLTITSGGTRKQNTKHVRKNTTTKHSFELNKDCCCVNNQTQHRASLMHQ